MFTPCLHKNQTLSTMATFKACIRKIRKDGFYPVYIRVTHNRKTGYIKTDKVVDKKGLSKTEEIKDSFVLSYCLSRINEYTERLNKEKISEWNIKDVIEFLEKGNEDICFSDYARKYKIKMETILKMPRNAKNYQFAYNHLERFVGTNKIMFSKFTTKFINDWINSLSSTSRAKELYPVCIRQIFKEAINEFNDYDRGVIRIKTNPWIKVKIPKSDTPEHKAISAEEIRMFFSMPLPPSKMILPLPELARDVAMMVVCLAGINTVDIYGIKKNNYKEGILSYNRSKTEKFRKDKAHMEIRVPDILLPILDKYKSDSDDEFLFNFHKTYSTYDSFGCNVNVGLRKLCKHNNIEEPYCVYTFRHSWGTIARNDIRASMNDVAFAMNHASAHRITETYVKPDYSIISELNQKVVDFIFGNASPNGYESKKEDMQSSPQMKISAKQMIKGTLLFRNESIFSFTDIGFNNIDEVINKLLQHVPSFVPEGCMVQLRIDNLDKDDFRVYERCKGRK